MGQWPRHLLDSGRFWSYNKRAVHLNYMYTAAIHSHKPAPLFWPSFQPKLGIRTREEAQNAPSSNAPETPRCHARASRSTTSRRRAWFLLLLGGIYTTQEPASIAQAFLPPRDPEAMPPHGHLEVSSRRLRTKPRSSVFCVAGFLTYTRPSGCVSDGP